MNASVSCHDEACAFQTVRVSFPAVTIRGAWRSPVARFVRDEEVGSSNLPAPTKETGPASAGRDSDYNPAAKYAGFPVSSGKSGERSLDFNP